MPYIIPSSAVTPGTVYQPGRGVPAYIRSNARAMACIKGGALSATHMLDQSPRNNGTRRTGQQGRCYNFDGIDDIVIANYQDLNLKGDLVLACRFNWDNGSASDKFLISFAAAGEAEDANVQYSIFLQASSGNELKYFHEYGSGTNEIVSLGWTPDPDVNYNLVVTRDSVNKIIKAYINGSEVGSNTYTNDPAGGSSAVFGIGGLNGSPVPFSGKIWDVRINDSIWGVDKINNYSSFGEFEEIGPVLGWWKCDEQSGTVAYDSSGNGYHGTITNATLSTFHATQDIWSFQNQVGYNLSGSVYIPRDESDPTNDVLGNPLSYTGRRPNDFKLTGSNCLTADGTLYIAAAHLAGTETVVSSGGTSTPTISAGRIDFTAGTCWDLTLSDGTHYPLSEGGGIGIYDDSGANNHGILTSATLASAWAGSQDEYHNNIIRGHGKRMYFDGVGNYIEVAGMAATVDYFGSCTISAKIILEEIPASPISIFSLGGSYRLFINSAGEYALNSSASPTGVSASIGLSEVSCEFDVLGRATSLSINGVIVWTGSAGSANPSIFFSIGAREISGYNFFFKGSIYDVSITGSSVKNFSLYGYGNQDADWFDITGTVDDSDISVNGSPSSMYLPAKTSSVDIFDQPLTHPAGDYHNGAETKVDFNPDSTPEMGATQLGITVPSAHAFGDAFASSDQIFSRQRTKTEDRFLVFTEAQTGSALTNIQKYTQQ